MRLDKFLAEMGVGSRSQVKTEMKKGLIRVNGAICKNPEQKIDPTQDKICYGNDILQYAAYEYYILNKPAGVISATEDKREKTVIDLIDTKLRSDLFPVGRLDKDTEGLLLITNDGALAHRLLHPKKHVDKTYFARVAGIMTETEVQRFQEGLDIGDDTPTLPARLVIKGIFQTSFAGVLSNGPESEPSDSETYSEVEITIHEGRFHQIKRMFEAVGSEVLYLKRLTMGPLVLPEDLQLGSYRPLTEGEKNSLGIHSFL